MGFITIIDERVFMYLFDVASASPTLGNLMISITDLSSTIFAGVYLLGIAYLIWRKDKKLIPFLLGPAAVAITVQALRIFDLRPRPFVALEIDSLIDHAANSSLPSMHAASAFVIASAIWYANKRLGALTFVLASITAISRVMVGVHFPMDIIVGALLGIGVCVGSFAVTKRFWCKIQQL